MKKELFVSVCVMIFLVGMISNVSAITASLGSSRMILRAGPGEVIERSLNVMNPNDVDITIRLTTTGENTENLILKEGDFRLEANGERKVYFTIKADEIGSTTSKINVAFDPDEGNGVGLTATIILIVAEEYAGEAGSVTTTGKQSGGSEMSMTLMLSISTLILVGIVLLIFAYSSKKKKGVRRTRDK